MFHLEGWASVVVRRMFVGCECGKNGGMRSGRAFVWTCGLEVCAWSGVCVEWVCDGAYGSIVSEKVNIRKDDTRAIMSISLCNSLSSSWSTNFFSMNFTATFSPVTLFRPSLTTENPPLNNEN